MAICRYLGFGAAADKELSKQFLKSSRKEQQLFDDTVKAAKRFSQPLYFDANKGKIAKLFEEGYIFPTDFVLEYQRSNLKFVISRRIIYERYRT
jgi:hypothetical protein